MNEIISVIIPVYKVEKYIHKCIDSVLSQTYSELEIILVDDGSPDSCGAICDEYAQKDERIKVIHKENGGLSDARNAGMKIATGKYISFIDSDDYILPDYFEALYKYFQEYDADLVAFPLCSVDEQGNKLSREYTGNVCVMDDKEAIHNMFARDGLPWCAQSKLYLRELFCGIEYPVGMLMEDKGTTYKIFAKCKKIVYADVPKYMYLVRAGSIMRSSFSEKRKRSFEIQKELNEFIEKNYPKTAHISHGYTVKVALSLLCMMSYCSYEDEEFSEELFSYLEKYKKEFFSGTVIDKRFKLLGRAIYALRAVFGKGIYKRALYKKITEMAAKVIMAK